MEKTFAGGSKTAKFVNVFSLKSFLLYGRGYYFMSMYTYSEAFLYITIDFVRVEFEEGWLNEQQLAISLIAAINSSVSLLG